jgi:biotin carboxyl carrier protein
VSAGSAALPSERSADGVRKHAVRATAVGFLTLAKEIHIGAKVAKGALVAQVEVLGIPTEVRALHGGIVVTLKAATGDPVEYGQEIFILESIGEVGK